MRRLILPAFLTIAATGCPVPYIPDFKGQRLVAAPLSVMRNANNLTSAPAQIEPFECSAYVDTNPGGLRGPDGSNALDVVGFRWRAGQGSSNFRIVQNASGNGCDVWHYASNGTRLDLGLSHIVRICARPSSADLFVATDDAGDAEIGRVYFVGASGKPVEIARAAPMAFQPIREGTADLRSEGIAFVSAEGDLMIRRRTPGGWNAPTLALDRGQTGVTGSSATLVATTLPSGSAVVAMGRGDGLAVTFWEATDNGAGFTGRVDLPIATGPLRGYPCPLDSARRCSAHIPLTFLRRASGTLDLLVTGDGTVTVARRRSAGQWSIASATPAGHNQFRYEGFPVRVNANGYRARCSTTECSAVFVWEPSDKPLNPDHDYPRPNALYEIVESRPPFRTAEAVQFSDAEAAGLVGWEVRPLIVKANTNGGPTATGGIKPVDHELRSARWVAPDLSSNVLQVTFDGLYFSLDKVQPVMRREAGTGLIASLGTFMAEVERYPTQVYPSTPSPEYTKAVELWRKEHQTPPPPVPPPTNDPALECAPDAICAEVVWLKNLSNTSCKLYDRFTEVKIETIPGHWEGFVDLANVGAPGYWLLACDPNYWEMVVPIWTRKLPVGQPPSIYRIGEIFSAAP